MAGELQRPAAAEPLPRSYIGFLGRAVRRIVELQELRPVRAYRRWRSFGNRSDTDVRHLELAVAHAPAGGGHLAVVRCYRVRLYHFGLRPGIHVACVSG